MVSGDAMHAVSAHRTQAVKFCLKGHTVAVARVKASPHAQALSLHEVHAQRRRELDARVICIPSQDDVYLAFEHGRAAFEGVEGQGRCGEVGYHYLASIEQGGCLHPGGGGRGWLRDPRSVNACELAHWRTHKGAWEVTELT